MSDLVDELRSAVPTAQVITDADVMDADQLHHVIDVIDEVLDIGARPFRVELGAPAVVLGALVLGHGTAAGTVLVKDITPGRARISLKGKGATLPTPTLPFAKDPRVIVQLRNRAGACWMADYGSALANTPTRFRAKSD